MRLLQPHRGNALTPCASVYNTLRQEEESKKFICLGPAGFESLPSLYIQFLHEIITVLAEADVLLGICHLQPLLLPSISHRTQELAY